PLRPHRPRRRRAAEPARRGVGGGVARAREGGDAARRARPLHPPPLRLYGPGRALRRGRGAVLRAARAAPAPPPPPLRRPRGPLPPRPPPARGGGGRGARGGPPELHGAPVGDGGRLRGSNVRR